MPGRLRSRIIADGRCSTAAMQSGHPRVSRRWPRSPTSARAGRGCLPRRRCRPPRAASRHRPLTGAARLRAGASPRLPGAAAGRRTTNSLPWPTPSLLPQTLAAGGARRAPRTRLRPMPSPPAARSSDRSACVNRSKTPGSTFGAMPIAVVPHPQHGACRRRSSQRERDAPAGLGVLGGVVEQVHHHLLQPGRVGVQPDRCVGAASP